MLQHANDYTRMYSNPMCKVLDLSRRMRLRCFETCKLFSANENVFSPVVGLFFNTISNTILIINEVPPTMQNDVRGFVKKYPPEVIIGLHSQ